MDWIRIGHGGACRRQDADAGVTVGNLASDDAWVSERIRIFVLFTQARRDVEWPLRSFGQYRTPLLRRPRCCNRRSRKDRVGGMRL